MSSVPSLHKSSALLSHRSQNIVVDGSPVVPGLGLGSGRNDAAKCLLVQGATNLTNKSIHGRNERGTHACARVNHVLRLIPNPRRKNPASRCSELRLELKIPGWAVAREGAGVSGGNTVADRLSK